MWATLGSTVLFASGFLFMTPGICGGPGLLGFDGMWSGYVAVALFLLGMAGFIIGLVWLAAVSLVLGSRKLRNAVDPTGQTP
jgi:hypothetical protein